MKNVMKIFAGMALVVLMFQAGVLVASKEVELFTFMAKHDKKGEPLSAQDLDTFKDLIVKDKEFIDEKGGPNNHTPLTWATEKNLPNMVEFILAKGANPDQEGILFNNPLRIAAEDYVRTGKEGYMGIFKKLLEYGANRKSINLFELSSWADPVKNERVEMLKNILELVL